MSEFVNSIFTKCKGLIKDKFPESLTVGNYASTFSQAMLKMSDLLSDRVAAYDNLIYAFIQDSELIADEWIDKATFSFENSLDYAAKISRDTAQSIRQAVLDTITSLSVYRDTAINDRLAIIDGQGYTYMFIPVDVYVDGYHVTLASNNNPSSLKEAIIYSKSGVYYINNVVLSTGYTGVESITITELVRVIGNVLGVSFINNDIFNNLVLICNKLQLSSPTTILQAVTMMCTYYNLDATGRIYDDLTTIVLDGLHVSLSTSDFAVNSILDILSNVIETNEINTLFSDVLLTLQSTTDFAGLVGKLNNYLMSKYASVKKIVADLQNAFLSGGFVAVFNYIAQFFNQATSMYDDDGVMKFSDNASLLPQQYIASIVATITNVSLSIISAVVSFINAGVGVAISIVGSVTMSIINKVVYDYDSTRPSLYDSKNAAYPIFPYGLDQHTVPANNIDYELLRVIKEVYPMLAIEIPGGFLFIGVGGYNNEGEIDSIKYEFHPSIESHITAFEHHFSRFLGDSDFEVASLGEPGQPSLGYSFLIKAQSLYRFSVDSVLRAWLEYDNIATIHNDSDGYVSISGSKQLAHIAYNNIAWYTLFQVTLTRKPPYYSGDVKHSYAQWVGLLDTDIGTVDLTHINYSSILSAFCWGSTRTWHGVIGDAEHILHTDGYGMKSWSSLTEAIVDIDEQWVVRNGDTNIIKSVTTNHYYYNYPNHVPKNFEYPIKLPKYDERTFFLWVFLSTIIVISATVLIATISFKAKRVIRRKRSILAANVEKAHNEFVKNPNNDTYDTYNKARRKNNMWANIIGGNKYTGVSYWDGDVKAGTSTEANPSVSCVASIVKSNYGENLSDLSIDQNDQKLLLNTEDVITLIRGY